MDAQPIGMAKRDVSLHGGQGHQLLSQRTLFEPSFRNRQPHDSVEQSAAALPSRVDCIVSAAWAVVSQDEDYVCPCILLWPHCKYTRQEIYVF